MKMINDKITTKEIKFNKEAILLENHNPNIPRKFHSGGSIANRTGPEHFATNIGDDKAAF